MPWLLTLKAEESTGASSGGPPRAELPGAEKVREAEVISDGAASLLEGLQSTEDGGYDKSSPDQTRSSPSHQAAGKTRVRATSSAQLSSAQLYQTCAFLKTKNEIFSAASKTRSSFVAV